MTYEQRMYDALVAHGGWAAMREIRKLVNDLELHSVTRTLQRLKKRGALQRNGKSNLAVWKAIPGFEIVDKRQFNGFKPLSDKPQVVRLTKAPKHEAVLGSALAQSLAWKL